MILTENMENIQLKSIKVRTITSISLNDAIREAIALAMDELTDVELEHNHKFYLISYENIIQSIKDNN